MTAAAKPLGTLTELRAELAEGGSSVALVERVLARTEAHSGLRAFVSLRGDSALEEARAADSRRAAGRAHSGLDGLPFAIKDDMVQEGEPAGCASRILEGYRSPFGATAIERLEAAGVLIVGRTNMDEFAMGSSTEHSVHGPTQNPWRAGHSPGGSSGGSAAAVAAGLVPVALGSDTGGSIRQPAAFTGVVGMKPTYGRVSRYGLVAFASSLDQIGPFARTAAECAEVLDAISGHDPRDSTSLPEPATRCADALTGDVAGLRVGLPRECFEPAGADAGVLERVREVAAEFERAGAKICEVSLPQTPNAVAAYYLICTAEASSNLARFDGVRYGHRAEGARGLTDLYERSRSEGFGREVKRRILLGTYVLSSGYYDAYYRKAQQVRTLVRRDFDAAFESCDLLLTPTTPETAFRIGERSGDPVQMYLSDVYTVSANLAGLPAASFPVGLSEGLPVGAQLLAPPLEDAAVLRGVDAWQRRTDFHLARPEEKP